MCKRILLAAVAALIALPAHAQYVDCARHFPYDQDAFNRCERGNRERQNVADHWAQSQRYERSARPPWTCSIVLPGAPGVADRGVLCTNAVTGDQFCYKGDCLGMGGSRR